MMGSRARGKLNLRDLSRGFVSLYVPATYLGRAANETRGLRGPRVQGYLVYITCMMKRTPRGQRVEVDIYRARLCIWEFNIM